MNNIKICFICCANDTQYEEEWLSYLQQLAIPKGIEVEVQIIHDASSMTSAYNQAMKSSDAKYKVYLHQDVFIWNRHFLYDMIDIFESNSNIGMLGVLGGTNIPDDGVLYTCWNEGCTYACNTQNAGIAGIKQGENFSDKPYKSVEALDGMLLATQYDIPWREDVFDAWDFYDVSQSFEFRRAGYDIVVPYQGQPWCMHDCGRTKLQNYNAGRKIVLEEYKEFFRNPRYSEEDFPYNDELKYLYDELRRMLIKSMEDGDLESAKALCGKYDDAEILDTDLSILGKLVSVCDVEKQLHGKVITWQPGMVYRDVLQQYHKVKFLLWRWEQQVTGYEAAWMQEYLNDKVSLPCLIQISIHNVYDFTKLCPIFLQLCVEKKDSVDLEYLKIITSQIQGLESLDFDGAQASISAGVGVNINGDKTAEEIAQIEQLCNEIAETRRKYLPAYIEKIDALLEAERYSELSPVLSDEKFAKQFETDTDMAYMMLCNQIYLEEVQDGIEKTVFTGHASIASMISYIQDIKFRLWHLEFETDTNVAEEMLVFIKNNMISSCLLRYMVHVAGMDKIGLLERLATIFLDAKMLGYAFSMLKYAEELAPGAEDILCTMAELCLRAGKKEEALECLDKVTNPTQITETFRRLCV